MKVKTKLSPEVWETIKLASIKGIPDKVICARYGLSISALAVRRFRDPEWRIAAGKKLSSKKGNHSELQTFLVDNREAIASENQVLLSQYIHGKIKSVITKDTLSEPENWGEMKTANDIFRKSVGLDKEQAAVSINFGWAANENEPAICEFSLDAASDIC